MHGPGGHTAHVTPSGHRWDTRIEIIIAVLLGAAAIAGAYAAYKNEGRDHKATVSFNEGIRLINESSTAATEATQTFAADNALFLQYAQAAYKDDTELAQYMLQTLMSPNLRAGVLWWSNAKNTPDTPFVDENPDYKYTARDRAEKLREQSDESFVVAKEYQEKADRYTLIEVILASALFLIGIAGVTRRFSIKLGAMGAGAVIFVVAIGMLITA